MDNSKKRSPWQIANATVLLLHLVLPVWLVAWMYTPAISSILLPVMMICGLLPGVCSKLVKKFQKGKGLLIASRVLAVFAITAFYTPLVVLRSAKEVQLLYPLKRFLYTYGVYGDGRSGIYEALLPEQLPDACTGYRFRTQGTLSAWFCCHEKNPKTAYLRGLSASPVCGNSSFTHSKSVCGNR